MKTIKKVLITLSMISGLIMTEAQSMTISPNIEWHHVFRSLDTTIESFFEKSTGAALGFISTVSDLALQTVANGITFSHQYPYLSAAIGLPTLYVTYRYLKKPIKTVCQTVINIIL